jgi:hypothetical protein
MQSVVALLGQGAAALLSDQQQYSGQNHYLLLHSELFRSSMNKECFADAE